MRTSRHFTASGRPQLPDMSERSEERFEATAVARMRIDAPILTAMASGDFVQGDVLAVAALGGISGARNAGEVLLLGQVLSIISVVPEFHIPSNEPAILEIHITVTGVGAGIDCAALLGACAAAANVFDLLKAADPKIYIEHAGIAEHKRVSAGTAATSAYMQTEPEEPLTLGERLETQSASQLRIPRLRVIRQGEALSSMWTLTAPKVKKPKAKPKRAPAKRRGTLLSKSKAKPRAKAKPRTKVKTKAKPRVKAKSKAKIK